LPYCPVGYSILAGTTVTAPFRGCPKLERSIDAEYGNSVALVAGGIAQLGRQIKPDPASFSVNGLSGNAAKQG
jgi:hypothetical protein